MTVVNSLRYVALGLTGMTLLAGCTSMPQGVFPMQNMSRVPAPGTGTYNLPGNYYGAAPATGQALSGQTPSGQALPGQPLSSQPNRFGSEIAVSGGQQPLPGSLPTTDLVANSSANSSMVQPAQFNRYVSQPAAAGPVQTAGYSAMNQPPGGFSSQTLSAGRFDSSQQNAASNNVPMPSDTTLNWK